MLKQVPGAADVFPDQIVGEGYLEIDIDREKAARYGVNVGDIQDVVETALGGKTITTTVEGRERFPVRIRYARAFREDEESVKNLLDRHQRTDDRAQRDGRRRERRRADRGRDGPARSMNAAPRRCLVTRPLRRRRHPDSALRRWPTSASSKARR